VGVVGCVCVCVGVVLCASVSVPIMVLCVDSRDRDIALSGWPCSVGTGSLNGETWNTNEGMIEVCFVG
jgi:hypothetical protein